MSIECKNEYSASLGEVNDQLRLLVGQNCWGVRNKPEESLRLDFGGVMRRTCSDKECHETGQDTCVGEFDILVWCAWRLQDSENAICSSDNSDEQYEEASKRLIGKKVVSFEISPPAWDATITFTDNLVLKIFCIYTQDDENETNWFFRNKLKLYCFNRCDDIEIANIAWDIEGVTCLPS